MRAVIAEDAVLLREGLARLLLEPGERERLIVRVDTLEETRAGMVAAADAERRRIERDLHDGAQQRLAVGDAVDDVEPALAQQAGQALS